MFESCLKKQKEIIDLFKGCSSSEEMYQKIIELGKTQTHIDPIYKVQENKVLGCQSTMYLVSKIKDGKVYFNSEADALISAGLAILLTRVYSGETPEVILKCPPTYLEDLGIKNLLTPSRSSGLASVYLRIKQDALRYLIKP